MNSYSFPWQRSGRRKRRFMMHQRCGIGMPFIRVCLKPDIDSGIDQFIAVIKILLHNLPDLAGSVGLSQFPVAFVNLDLVVFRADIFLAVEINLDIYLGMLLFLDD